MAAAVSSKKKTKASKTAVAKSKKPKFTANQWKAYQNASKAAIRKAQFSANVRALQERRLQGAFKAARKTSAARNLAVVARQRAFAERQTWRQAVTGQQGKRLRLQAAARLFQAQSVATQRQFSYRGEAIHAHTTFRQTLTYSQAVSQESRVVAAARRNARKNLGAKPVKSVAKGRPKGKTKYASLGKKAGLAAARRTTPVFTRKPRLSKPKPAKKAKAQRTSPVLNASWITAGNTEGRENCAAVAVANHLFLVTGTRLSDDKVSEISRIGGFTVPGCAEAAGGQAFPALPVPGSVVVFESENGTHAGVKMPGGNVVSWGEVRTLTETPEESWIILWEKRKK